MEEKFTRRYVLQAGTGVMLSVVGGSALIFPHENAQAVTVSIDGMSTPLASASEYSFFLSSTSLSRFQLATNTLSKTTALSYTVPSVKDNADSWPVLTLDNLEAWTLPHTCATCEETLTPSVATSNNANTFIDHVMNTKVTAAFDVADITGELSQSSMLRRWPLLHSQRS